MLNLHNLVSMRVRRCQMWRSIVFLSACSLLYSLPLTCLAVSVSIKGKSAAELRAIFNISNEFTPEEEAQVRPQN